MKTFTTRILILLMLIPLSFLMTCGGGNGRNNLISPLSSATLLGKVIKIAGVVSDLSSVYNLIAQETQDCDCKNDFAYIVVSSDRKKGVSIYIDDAFVGEANREQSFFTIVTPGSHTVTAEDNKRNRKWEKTVTLDDGGIELLCFNKENWEKDDD